MKTYQILSCEHLYPFLFLKNQFQLRVFYFVFQTPHPIRSISLSLQFTPLLFISPPPLTPHPRLHLPSPMFTSPPLIVPLLPFSAFQAKEWVKWVEVQGSWMLKEGNTDDVLHTSRITCIRKFNRCIDSTASLVNASVPKLKVQTHVYDIKQWDEHKIVSMPYDGEACVISILRISKNPPLVTRFVSSQGSPGACANVKNNDRQYLLEDGRKIYQILKMQKSKAIQQILQVAHHSSEK